VTLQKRQCPACQFHHFLTKEQWDMVGITNKCPGPKLFGHIHDGKPMKEKK